MKKKIKYPCIAEVTLPKGHEALYPFKNGEHVLLLGEISNMPGHVAFTNQTGIIHYGYHLEDFRVLSGEET